MESGIYSTLLQTNSIATGSQNVTSCIKPSRRQDLPTIQKYLTKNQFWAVDTMIHSYHTVRRVEKCIATTLTLEKNTSMNIWISSPTWWKMVPSQNTSLKKKQSSRNTVIPFFSLDKNPEPVLLKVKHSLFKPSLKFENHWRIE